jgi:hypothetical protein
MIGEQVIVSYLQHVETNQKSPFFNGISDEMSTEIWRFGKSFEIFYANFTAPLPSLPSFYRLGVYP